MSAPATPASTGAAVTTWTMDTDVTASPEPLVSPHLIVINPHRVKSSDLTLSKLKCFSINHGDQMVSLDPAPRE